MVCVWLARVVRVAGFRLLLSRLRPTGHLIPRSLNTSCMIAKLSFAAAIPQ